MTVPLSILDLSPISEGSDAATALRNTVDLAQHAEQWGYQAVLGRRAPLRRGRQLVAPRCSSARSRPPPNTIRVGAAAVQLGHTTAVAVVETFGMLDAFHPGRIDLGVGRSGQRRREAQKQPASRSPQARAAEWRDVDGVVVPPPFDISALDAQHRRLRAHDVGAAAARSGLTGFRRSGRRHPRDARRPLPDRRLRRACRARRAAPA